MSVIAPLAPQGELVARLIGARGTKERAPDDFYATPPYAAGALLGKERFQGRILEPACGDGAISRVLEAAGHEVVSTDLVARGYGEGGLDFTLFGYPYAAPNVVTNPPYSLADRFVRAALESGAEKVAMLLKLAFLEGEARADLFDEQPFARLWVFRRRVAFLRNGTGEGVKREGGMIAFAWFVRDRSHRGEARVGWLKGRDSPDPAPPERNGARGQAGAP